MKEKTDKNEITNILKNKNNFFLIEKIGLSLFN